MSIPSSPLPATHLDEDPASLARDSSHSITRTVAIIKTHALNHRLDIEPRIYQAGFEIVKERQMEFDMESDPEVMYELFGDDAESFSEGPVWVYVVERPRAVEVWNILMGDADPDVARERAPTSLRALYGISVAQNGVMGSPDSESAELQIASLFASSPPFPATDLADMTPAGSLRSMSSSVLAELKNSANSEHSYARSSVTNASAVRGHHDKRDSFKARTIPASHLKPDIVPRTTRAASLRAGVPVQKTPAVVRAPLTKEAHARTFANVPGHKRAVSIAVASTAPPTIAPRMSRAAALRLGQVPAPQPVRKTVSDSPDRPSSTAANTVFEGVPGHKRRETISVSSTKAPTVAPRTNRSAALRLQKEAAPPSSFKARPAPRPLSRSSSQSSLNGSYARTPSRPASVSSFRPAEPSHTSSRDSVVDSTPNTNGSAVPAPAPEIAPKRRPRPSSLSAPSITPRPNKSALLRAGTGPNGKTPRKNVAAFI
jgi:nucleoside diphosphate kinase